MATRGTPDTAIDASVPSRADAASGEALSLPPTPAATPSLRPASPARTDSSAWPHQPPYGQAQAANGAHGYADGRGRGDGHGQGASASFATAAPGPPVSAEVRSQAMAWNPSLSHPVVDALVGEAVTALQRPRSPEHVDRKRKADHFDAMGGLYGVGNGGPGMAYPRKRVCRLLNIVVRPSRCAFALIRRRSRRASSRRSTRPRRRLPTRGDPCRARRRRQPRRCRRCRCRRR